MLEINKIKENKQSVIESLKKRGVDITKEIGMLLNLDKERIENQQKLDQILNEGNKIAQQIGQIARENTTKEDNVLMYKDQKYI